MENQNETDKPSLQAELDQINQIGGSFHERWLKGDPEVLAKREGLYKKLYPEPEPTPEPAPGEKLKPESAEGTKEFFEEEKRQALEDLKLRWGDGFDGKMADVRGVRDQLFDRSHPDARAAYEHLFSFHGNDARFVAFVADLKGTLADLPRERVSIEGLSEQQKESLAAQFANRLFGNIRNSEVARIVFEDIGDPPNPSLLNWFSELAARYYRYGK